MPGDPYQLFIDLIRREMAGLIPGGFVFGKVTSAPDEEAPDRPLKVMVAGTVQEAEDLLRNADLNALGFAAGDRLLLLPIENAQRYVILCKVVSA
jgi:hypothetical protein